MRHLLKRAGQLYVAAVSVALLEGAFAELTGVRVKTYPLPEAHSSAFHFVLNIVTLHRDYGSSDLLVMFACLMLIAPVLILLMAGRHTRILLVLSAALYLAQQAAPGTFSGLATLFPLAAVQFLFTVFAAIGWHRDRVGAIARRVPVVPRMWLAFAALLAIASSVATTDSAFARFTLHPQKLALFAVVALLAWDVVTLLRDQIATVAGWLLLPLGRNSLVAVVTHYGVVLPSYHWTGRPENQWIVAAYQIVAVAICWTVARHWESPRTRAQKAAVHDRLRSARPSHESAAGLPGEARRGSARANVP